MGNDTVHVFAHRESGPKKPNQNKPKDMNVKGGPLGGGIKERMMG
jgi:hypothetical protein